MGPEQYVIPLAVGSVLLVVSGFAWVARRDVLELAARIGRLSVSPISSVQRNELAAVVGAASQTEPLRDPVTQRDVVFYEAVVRREGSEPGELCASRRGDSFELKDDSGRAVVELRGAEIGGTLREVERSEGEPTQAMRELLSTAKIEITSADPKATYVLEHRSLEAGARLTVVGVPTVDPAGKETLLRFSARTGPLYVLETELAELAARERRDVRALTRVLALGALFGAVFVSVGAWLTLAS